MPSTQMPEAVLPNMRRLSAMVGGKPLISGEWGWTTCRPSTTASNCPADDSVADEARAGRLLARQWLSLRLGGTAIAIYYDFSDDCADEGSRE
jgi:hypothetical protein